MMSVHVERIQTTTRFGFQLETHENTTWVRNATGSVAQRFTIFLRCGIILATDGWRQKCMATLHNLEYTLGEKGDSRITCFKKQYTDDAYLTNSY